ncbi:hypothetical protein GCM10009665_25930 [Kitasatospora nipponensis]|uniref:Uncharacterized protein n=1 Tax=Kitasatospora nipponensis TaxID=258049 RepID=A0ABN1W9H9_9ACTN
MGRDYHFHCEHAGCSVTAEVYLGGTREVDVLVDGKEVSTLRVQGHGAQVRSLTAVLPTDPPRPVEIEVTLPGRISGEPASVLVRDGERFAMPGREVQHRSRPTEASWYG